MDVLMNSNLHTTEDMLMTYLFFPFIWSSWKIQKTIGILDIENKEGNNSMPFLDALITRTSDGFRKYVYNKPTFIGVYSNFNSFISKEYKVGLIFTLLFWTFSIILDFSEFYSEVCHLKEI